MVRDLSWHPFENVVVAGQWGPNGTGKILTLEPDFHAKRGSATNADQDVVENDVQDPYYGNDDDDSDEDDGTDSQGNTYYFEDTLEEALEDELFDLL